MTDNKQADPSSTLKWVKKVLREYAYRLLSRRDYSAGDLEFRMMRRLSKIAKKVNIFAGERVISEILAELEEKNFVNDQRFAENFLASRKGRRGVNLIRQEMIKKGVGKELVNQVLSGVRSDEEAARALLERKSKNWTEEGYKVKQKALALLMRNGFEYDLARELVESWFSFKYNKSKLSEDE